MAIVVKKFGRREYLYDVTCKRVAGKPRIVDQQYLGRREDVLGLTKKDPKAEGARVYDFGAIAALLDIAQELGLVALIDGVVKKRHQGLSAGQYLLLAALNRAVAPCSKRQLGDWYRQTVLRRLLGYRRRWLTSQRFWENQGRLTRGQITTIERRLNKVLTERFRVNLATLIYDTTNFYTYINTLTDARLPQRGRNKQRRGDLRQVGLALMVTRDFHIPLFHQVYAGNRSDSDQFASVLKELVKRHRALARGCKSITLVFDKGNNPADNQALLDEGPFHFIGSLVLTQHRDLLKVPRRRYKAVASEEYPGLLAYRTRKVVFGTERTVVLTFSPEFYAAQLRGILTVLKKKEGLLDRLSKRRGVTAEELKVAAGGIVVGQYIKEIIGWSVVEGKSGATFCWWVNEAALAQIKRERLGKKLLFTDNADWSTADIVAGYHGQYKIEHAFRQMKDPYFVSWWPMYCWTDQMVRVHGFYCVLALLLVSLLTRRVNEAGTRISGRRLLELLGEIREVEVIYPEGRVGFRSEYLLTNASKEAEALRRMLTLERYGAKRTA